MANTLYDKPVRSLLPDMLDDLQLKPGDVLTATRAIEWFAEHYPKVQASSLRAHLVQASANDPNRLHHSRKASDDLLFRVAAGQFRRYDPEHDPAPIRELVPGDVAVEEARQELQDDEDDEGPTAAPGSSEFLLERDLQRYLAENLDCIEPGMRLFEDEDGQGFEYEAGNGRRIDILAIDATGGLVVLELKVKRGYERVVGQLLRYVNWVKRNKATPGQRVRGLIVCRSISEDLRLACDGIEGVGLLEYSLSVTVTKVPPLA